MMEESGGDIENPPPKSAVAVKNNPHNNTPSNDPNKKLKIALLSTFLLVVVVLAIALGVTLQGNTNNNTSSSPSTSDGKGEGGTGGELTVAIIISTSAVPTITSSEITLSSSSSSSSYATETSPELLGQTTPTVDEATYLVSPGPIEARIRMATADIANGYTSCADLKDDILNALKHLANTVIVEQSKYGWYYETNCGDPVFIAEDTVADGTSFAPTSSGTWEVLAAAAPEAGETMEMDGSTASKFQEDSYETNNQVQGVDEADIVKSDGKHVFTAYGDVIFAWDAQDAKKGLSITRMPYNDTADKDCDIMPFPEPMPVDVIAVEEDTLSTKEPLPEETTTASGSSGRNRKAMMMADIMPMPCYKPKPQIHSLLLHGSRLTAIVSEQSSHYYSPYAAETSTLLDYQDLTIKV